MCFLYILFNFLFTALFLISFMTIFIAISSPSSIESHEFTGCLCIVGSVFPGIYMQAPVPQGPEFPTQEP